MKQVVFSFSYVLELKEGRRLFRQGRKKRVQSVVEKDKGAFYQKKYLGIKYYFSLMFLMK